jgi:predicted enzyme related to lactoylglutathione lyase
VSSTIAAKSALRSVDGPYLVAMANPPSLSLAEITIDCNDAVGVAAFWAALFGAPLSEPLPGWRRLGPLSPGGPVLNFQPVPEPKQGKVRIHLDLWSEDLTAAVARVLELGGAETGERHVYDEGVVVVLTDPEGHEFCVVGPPVQQVS